MLHYVTASLLEHVTKTKNRLGDELTHCILVPFCMFFFFGHKEINSEQIYYSKEPENKFSV